jgi:hypothetical protein
VVHKQQRAGGKLGGAINSIIALDNETESTSRAARRIQKVVGSQGSSGGHLVYLPGWYGVNEARTR